MILLAAAAGSSVWAQSDTPSFLAGSAFWVIQMPNVKIKIALACLFPAGLYAMARLSAQAPQNQAQPKAARQAAASNDEGEKGLKEIVHVVITRRRNCLIGKYERSSGRCA